MSNRVEGGQEMEKLIEEIAERLADYYVGEDADGLQFTIPFHKDREFIAWAITRIARAIKTGELDEWLGIVGRFDFGKDNWGDFENWVAQALHDDADIFIAFRQEETESQRDPEGKGGDVQ